MRQPSFRAIPIPVLAASLALSAVLPAGAQTVEALGSRALGLAGAFVAVADDATAVYWNPAGLATGDVFSLLVDRQGMERAPRDARGRPVNDRSAAIVAMGSPPLGLAYYRLRATWAAPAGARATDGPEDQQPLVVTLSSLVTHHTGVTLVQSVGDGLTVGATLKYVRGLAAQAVVPEAPGGPSLAERLDQAVDLVGRASSAFDLDVGLMASAGLLRVGLVARNLREPAFAAPDGSRLALERQVRVGLAVVPAEELTVALDVDLTRTRAPDGDRRHVAFGAEQRVGERTAVRGGVRVNLLGDLRPAGAAGASFAIQDSLWIDGQITRGSAEEDRGWGLALRVAF